MRLPPKKSVTTNQTTILVSFVAVREKEGDILMLHDLMKYAQQKLAEAEKNDSGNDMRYWAAYLDGVKAAERRVSAHEHGEDR